MPDVATLVARRLHEAGCRFAFGIPGGEVLHLIDALERAGIRFVLCKHENAGGFMAAGSFHATGAPAVVVATVGPGVANLVNAVADAYLDRVPMIVLTGCVDAGDAVGFTHQILDHRALLAPVVKAGFTLVPDAAGAMVDKALAIATDPRPGPVHLDVPIRVARAEASGPVPRRATPAPVGPAAGAELDAARALLRASRRPIAVAGLDILARPETAARVASFLERFEIPLITTYKAKGVLPEDHPLALGAAGLSPKADAVLLPLVGRSDCVLLFGYDPVEMRAGWR
ncbi:MAG TPA: thiamine pyrophosphate-binding protein, partial [Rhodospirillales bacterium]|nr:thiamine pyrophosphate-binding protein [Rhodospirillales bacterium]